MTLPLTVTPDSEANPDEFLLEIEDEELDRLEDLDIHFGTHGWRADSEEVDVAA